MDDWFGDNVLDINEKIADNKDERRDKVKTAFAGLEDVMNIPNGSTPIPKGIAKTVKKNTEVAIQATKELLAESEEPFEDKEFIRDIIKTQIIQMQSTLQTMEGNLMVGSEPRMFEVYSDLNKSVLDACSKLMALQKQSENSKMMKAPDNTNEVTLTETKQIKAKGSDMSAFLEQLRGGAAIQ